jgi:hypothetical protein
MYKNIMKFIRMKTIFDNFNFNINIKCFSQIIKNLKWKTIIELLYKIKLHSNLENCLYNKD